MENLVKYLDCGYYAARPYAFGDFLVLKFSDLTDKIIPFFEKYSLHGVKSLEYKDFCKVADIMKVKGHLTTEGIEEIYKIKAGMNKGRE